MNVSFTQQFSDYKNIKLSQNDMRSVLVGIDMQLDVMVREAKDAFNKYIDTVDIIHRISCGLGENATQIENDQFNAQHFHRVRGQLHSDARNYMNQMVDCVRDADKASNKYFDICYQINELMRLRDNIIERAKIITPIEKPDVPVECKSEAKKASK
jgi:hypothetical protein